MLRALPGEGTRSVRRKTWTLTLLAAWRLPEERRIMLFAVTGKGTLTFSMGFGHGGRGQQQQGHF